MTVTHQRSRIPGLVDPSIMITDPAAFSGLALWFRPDALSALADNDPVSLWNDASVNARNGISSGTARPIYRTNQVNGWAALDFGASGYIDYGTWNWATCTWLLVCKRKSVTNNCFLLQSGSSYSYLQYGDGRYYAINGAITEAMSTGSFMLKGARYTGTQVKLITNATNLTPVNTAAGSQQRYIGGGGSFTSEIWVSELIVYDRAVTDAELVLLRGYVNGKYALW